MTLTLKNLRNLIYVGYAGKKVISYGMQNIQEK